MRRNYSTLAWIFGLLLALSAITNGVLVVRQLMIYRDIESLNAKIILDPQIAATIQKAPQVQNITRSLVQDLLVYSQKQPDIGPVLLKYGVKSQSLSDP